MHKKFIIKHQLSQSHIRRFRYVVNFLNAHPLKPVNFSLYIDNQTNTEDLFYGKKTGQSYTVPVDGCFLDENQKIPDLSVATTYSSFRFKELTAISNKYLKQDDFYKSNKFSFDFFNTIFFLISRYEEYHASVSDHSKSGWLTEKKHFLILNELHTIPLVDLLVNTFFSIITGQPITKKSSYSISHDVDILTRFTPGYKFFRSLGATIMHQRGWPQFRDSIIYYNKMLDKKIKDPYNYFDILLRKENQWSQKYIYLMTGGSTKYDNKYKVTDPVAKNIIQLATDRNYIIGLHPSYNAGFEDTRYTDEQRLLAKNSNHAIADNRQHCLRWSWEITPHLFEKNAIKTDSTMGYNRYLGFRCGTGFPYQMYDFKNEKVFSWIEHPMAFMESSAIHLAHRTGVNLTELMRDFILKNKENTHLMLNFHNSNFDPLLDTGRQLRHFYEKELLDLCYG